VDANETVSVQGFEELNAILSVVASTQMVQINAVTYLNASVSGDAVIEIPPGDMNVSVSGAVVVAAGSEQWTHDITVGESIGLVVAELSQSVDEKGWIIDPLNNYDLRGADDYVVDAAGAVTMTIIITP
jgi:hypothetical protein